MKLVKLFIIASTLAVFIVACGDSNTNSTNQTANAGATPSASPKATATPAVDELAEAKATFGQVCANCHGDKGEGGPVKIENKRLNVPSLTSGHGLEHTDAQFAKQIAQGGDGMPAFKDRLNEQQINNLVRFIRRDIQGGTTTKAGGGDAKK